MEKIESKFKDVEIVEEIEQIEEMGFDGTGPNGEGPMTGMGMGMGMNYDEPEMDYEDESMEELDDFDMGFDRGYDQGYADALDDQEVGDDYSIDAEVYESVKEESKNLLVESKLEEAVDIKKIIDTVIDTNWSGSNEEQLRSVQLLKGLATSTDPLSNKFMKALDSATSKMKKDDFK